MRLGKLLQSELETLGIAKLVLERTFIEGQETGYGETENNNDTTTLKLPINEEGRPIQEPVKSAPILVKLQREGEGLITLGGVKGKELLPDEKVPILFKAALAKVNAQIRKQNEQIPMTTIDPRKLDKLEAEDPDRTFRKRRK